MPWYRTDRLQRHYGGHEQRPLRNAPMIGTDSPSHPRFAAAFCATTLLLLAGACNRGSRGAPNLAPTIVAAALAGSSATPAAGDELLLFFSEDVTLSGALLTDTDVALSGGATLGAVGA